MGCGRSPAPEAPRKPVRIASLTLATDEMLAELVPVERIAAVSAYVDNEASNVAGRYPKSIVRLTAELERVSAVGPDLICVASYSSADFLEMLGRVSLPVFRMGAFTGLDDIERQIRRLGDAVGEPEAAAKLAGRFAERRRALADRLKGVTRRPKVLYWSSGYTYGAGSTYDDVIREAGGVNAAADAVTGGSGPISDDRTFALDPDVILVESGAAGATGDPAAALRRNPVLSKLRAVREDRIIAIPGRLLSSVSHHVMDGVEELARKLHPETFRAP